MNHIEWPEDLDHLAPRPVTSQKREKAFVNFNVNSKSKIAALSKDEITLKQQRLDQYRLLIGRS
jgi:hypothetical protein